MSCNSDPGFLGDRPIYQSGKRAVRCFVRMSATIENDESNQIDIVNIMSCVAISYEKGKSG